MNAGQAGPVSAVGGVLGGRRATWVTRQIVGLAAGAGLNDLRGPEVLGRAPARRRVG